MNGKQIIFLVLGTTLSGCSPQAPLSNLPLQERLRALAERSEPKIQSLNAMCYVIAEAPSRADYHCPACGSKTAYEVKFLSKNPHAHARDMEVSWGAPVRNVEKMRDKMKKLAPLARQNGYKFLLDESGLCARCGKERKADFVLIAVDADGKETRTEGFNEDDIVYLTAFFEGADYYKRAINEKFPLKKNVQRISQLLGLKLD